MYSMDNPIGLKVVVVCSYRSERREVQGGEKRRYKKNQKGGKGRK